jgi:hypothetical protein
MFAYRSVTRVVIVAATLAIVAVAAVGSTASSVSRGTTIGSDVTVKCSGVNPCQTYANSSTGIGVKGTSVGGVGVSGSSKNFSGIVGVETAVYPSPLPSGIFFGRSGVEGDDKSVDFNEQGVLGTSVNGIGTSGTSTTSFGVFGYTASTGSTLTNSSAGVFGLEQSTSQPDFNFGTVGFALNGVGVFGRTKSEGPVAADAEAGVIGIDTAQTSTFNDGVAGLTTNGSGAFFDSINGTGAIAVSKNGNGLEVQAQGTGTSTAVLGLFSPNGVPLILADGPTKPAMSLDASGNMILRGKITTNGNPLIVQRGSTGASYVGYSPIITEATIEDVGEAEMQNGAADVRLDPALASTMDLRKGYIVFAQPEGMIQGSLCVVSRTMVGFSVRESGGGRSSVAFAYRIVGRPFGSDDRRLPLETSAQSPLASRMPDWTQTVRAFRLKAEMVARARRGLQ